MEHQHDHPGGHLIVDTEQMGNLVNFVGDFAYSMLRTFVVFQDDMTEEARIAFDQNVKNFTARVGEWFPMERLIEEAMRERGGSDAA